MSGKVEGRWTAARGSLERSWKPLSPEDLERICLSLLKLSPGQRSLWVRNSRRAAHPDVPRQLVAKSYGLRLTDPVEALLVGQAAVEAASALDLGAAWAGLLSDLRAQAWGNLANCYRLVENLRQAEDAWRQADEFLEIGSGNKALAADLARKKGELRLAQTRFGEAIGLQEKAVALQQEAGELSSRAKTQVGLAVTHYYAGQVDQALEVLPLAAQHLDVRREPEMGFAYVHNLLLFLEAAGDFPCALRLSLRAERQYQELASPLVLLRGWWLRGRLLLGVGDWRGARPFLELARRGFLERELLYDAALAGFDLALAWTHQNERFRVQRLACEMFEVFRSQQIPREAAAALQLFAEAAKAWKADLALMRRLAADLEPLRRPGLPAQTEAP